MIEELKKLFVTIPESEKEQAKKIVDEFNRQVVELIVGDSSDYQNGYRSIQT